MFPFSPVPSDVDLKTYIHIHTLHTYICASFDNIYILRCLFYFVQTYKFESNLFDLCESGQHFKLKMSSHYRFYAKMVVLCSDANVRPFRICRYQFCLLSKNFTSTSIFRWFEAIEQTSTAWNHAVFSVCAAVATTLFRALYYNGIIKLTLCATKTKRIPCVAYALRGVIIWIITCAAHIKPVRHDQMRSTLWLRAHRTKHCDACVYVSLYVDGCERRRFFAISVHAKELWCLYVWCRRPIQPIGSRQRRVHPKMWM